MLKEEPERIAGYTVYLYEMAKRAKDIKRDLEGISPMLFRHLVKYFYVNDSYERSHWGQEIYALLNDIPKEKNTKKYPTREFIMKCLYNTSADSILDKKPYILDDYRGKCEIIDIPDDNKFLEFCGEYIERVSHLLSVYGAVNEDTVKFILGDIIKKYQCVPQKKGEESKD